MLSRSRRDGHFVGIMRCENTKQHFGESVAYPRDRMPDWELQLAANAQHHERVSYHLSLAQEKIKIINLDRNI